MAARQSGRPSPIDARAPASLAGYPVIVTDGLWRKSLSAIRALGRAGFEVHVMGNTPFTAGFWSRHAHASRVAPVAAEDPRAFGAALLDYLEGFPPGKPPVILPMEDATLLWLSENRLALEGRALFAIPSPEAIRASEDKSLTLELAESLGLPVPGTWRPRSVPELLDRLSAVGGTGWVVKPCTGSGSSGIVYGSEERLGAGASAFWEEHWRRYGTLLVQERVPATGRAVGASFLMDGAGRVLARFTHERLRQYPVSGGPSTDRIGIRHPEIEAWSEKLLCAQGWRGVAMVEWKSDPRDGKFKLMEINPRFWGSLELAVRSGVDFPVLYARLCLGDPSLAEAAAPGYREGVRCRWLIPGEILRYLGTPSAEREGLVRFCRGLPRLAEEWDPGDLRGGIATLACTGLLALNPAYWKFLRRG